MSYLNAGLFASWSLGNLRLSKVHFRLPPLYVVLIFFLPTVFPNSTMRDEEIETIVGGPVALECDYATYDPFSRVQWYANGSIPVDEVIQGNTVLYLEGGRYLYIRQLTASQRTMRYHCEIIDEISNMTSRSPTTYVLTRDLSNINITEYRGLGTQLGRVGEPLKFVYAAANRLATDAFMPIGINCQNNSLVTISVGNDNVITATLRPESANEMEISFVCNLVEIGLQIMGNIIVSGTCQ